MSTTESAESWFPIKRAATPQPSAVLSICGPAGDGASAPAGSQKRRRAGEGSAEERGRGARGPHISKEDYDRLSAMAVSLREEFLSNGVTAEELVSCCLSFREEHLPNFPVIRSGAWARLSPAALTEAVLSVLRDARKPSPRLMDCEMPWSTRALTYH